MYNAGVGVLVARGAFLVTFFIAKKVTKKSSRSLNSLSYSADAWLPGLLSRLILFQVLFLELIIK
jgi:hypothetical protein